MNQILLMHEEEPNRGTKKAKREPGQKADIKNVIRFFSVLLIIVGIVMISKSVYAIVNNREKLKDKLEVEFNKMGKEVTVSVSSEHPVKELKYKWNQGLDTTINGNETVHLETIVEIPNGNNILNITVIDYYGNEQYYQHQYIYESIDSAKPVIEMAKVGDKLQVKATDNMEIAYLEYHWNEEEPIRIEPEDNKTEVVTEIEVLKGSNKIYIVAVDGEENKATRDQLIVGASKPSITMQIVDGKKLSIVAKDDSGVKKITVNVDGNVTDSGEDSLDLKEVSAEMPIEPGEHLIKVIVTNIYNIEATKEINATI